MAEGNKTPVPLLTLKTRDHRWNVARKFMQDQGLDALYVHGEHEDSGAAPFNFDVWFTNSRPGNSILFPLRGDPIQLLAFPPGAMDHLEATNNGEEVWIPVQNLRLGRGLPTIAAALHEFGLSKATIGVVGLEPSLPWYTEGIIPYTLWQKVISQFPQITFKPILESFVQTILPLNDEELNVVRHAASIGNAMARAVVGSIRPGARESDVFAAGIFEANIRGGAAPMFHITSTPNPMTWGAPKWSFKPMEPKVIQTGDVVCAEIFSFFGILNTQQQLVVAVGDVHEEVLRAAEIARKCYEIGLKELRSGARFGDVGRAMLEPVRETGGWSRGPQIHSLNPLYAISGFDSNLDQISGADRYPSMTAVIPTLLDDMVIKPGMTFALEPGCGFGQHTVSLGSTVIIGQDGAIEELTPFTAKLHKIEA